MIELSSVVRDFTPNYIDLCVKYRLVRSTLLRGDYYVDDRWQKDEEMGRRNRPFRFLYKPMLTVHHADPHVTGEHLVWIPRIDQLMDLLEDMGYAHIQTSPRRGGLVYAAARNLSQGKEHGELGVCRASSLLLTYTHLAGLAVEVPESDYPELEPLGN